LCNLFTHNSTSDIHKLLKCCRFSECFSIQSINRIYFHFTERRRAHKEISRNRNSSNRSGVFSVIMDIHNRVREVGCRIFITPYPEYEHIHFKIISRKNLCWIELGNERSP
jgi:hypothetical protein